MSLLNDMAGELLYPVLPLYLTSIGYGVVWIGILEGVAEAVAGSTKSWFGEWSDHLGKRLPFVRFGYFLSAIAKPSLIFIASPFWALFTRASDRLGKGVRTGARDAMLAEETGQNVRGKVFGFHRAMDTAGAFIGPVIALVWIGFHRDGNYRPLFYFALLPGLFGVSVLFLLKEKAGKVKSSVHRKKLFSFSYWKRSSRAFRRLVGILTLFALFNSSDMFLLLRVKDLFPNGAIISGWNISPAMLVIACYIFSNFIYAIISFPAGSLSDRSGPKKMLIMGFVFFVMMYSGMALLVPGHSGNLRIVVLLFFIYGLYSAFTDGISRAWVSMICGQEDKGKALGLFSAFASIATLFASVTAGLLWKFAGPLPVFILPSLVAVITIFWLIFLTKEPEFKKK
ncbi:MAG: MFS transporter [Bacteroidetes bacterium]|nr:MFS transporter [Bacteroidota bacterium]